MKEKLYINGRFLVQSITGVQRVAREFIVALDMLLERIGSDEKITIYYPAKEKVVAIEYDFKCLVFEPVGSLSGHLWEQLELPKYLGGGKLLCLGNTAPVFSLLSRSTKVVTMVHDLSYKYFPDAYSWKFRLFYSFTIPLVLKYSEKVFTVSKSEFESILHNYPNLINDTRLSYHQNGGWGKYQRADVPEYGSRLKRLLYVGSLTDRKNAGGLIRAAIDFVLKYPDFEFYFIGANGPSFGGVKIDIDDDVKDRVKFLGQVDDSEVLKSYYKSSLALVFPSFYEASPLPPIEAMGLGCPVVSSNIKSLRERCGEAAVYCDPNNVTSIVDSIEKLVTNVSLWTEYSDRGIQKAMEYTWDKQVESIMELI
jgi:glycosyltransferase involved in cell wall biosynthesis